jgi:5'-nucleotidase
MFHLLPGNAPFGGIARIATLAKQIRASATRSLWLDSGDSFQGAPVFHAFKGEAELRALTVAGLDGAALGDHELDLGAPHLLAQIDRWAGFPLLAANYAWDDPPAGSGGRSLRDVIAPYEVFDVQGLKIGVIGMANTSVIPAIFEAGNALGLRPIADGDALAPWVRFLRPQVDLIVVVSHLGPDEDEELTASQVDDPNQALPLDGVDLVLGGHLHIVTNPPRTVAGDRAGHETIVVHSGAFARYVGRLDLVVHVGSDNGDPDRRSRITKFSYVNLPVDATVADDPAVASVMAPYAVQLRQDVDLDGAFAYVQPRPAGATIARGDPSGGDSQLGNLMARAMQRQDGAAAELALTDSLRLHADLPRGPLTIAQMFNVLPFENTVVVMYLSGAELQDTLDVIARRAADHDCKTQAQVAGIAFDMVCRGDCPGGNTACAKNVSIGDRCRKDDDPSGPLDPGRCAALVPTSLYRVAVNDYIAAGGLGFQALGRSGMKQDTGVSLRDSLRMFLARQAACTSQLDETDPQVPPRLVVERYGAIACLDDTLEAHDGRIRAVRE